MSYQEKYNQARKAGYSDQEIMEHLATKDPTFEEKMTKAQEAGYSPEEVLGYFNSAPKQREESDVEMYGKDVLKQGARQDRGPDGGIGGLFARSEKEDAVGG